MPSSGGLQACILGDKDVPRLLPILSGEDDWMLEDVFNLLIVDVGNPLEGALFSGLDALSDGWGAFKGLGIRGTDDTLPLFELFVDKAVFAL